MHGCILLCSVVALSDLVVEPLNPWTVPVESHHTESPPMTIATKFSSTTDFDKGGVQIIGNDYPRRYLFSNMFDS
jgi:hypothetical protein